MRFDVNWEADSTSFLAQRPLAAINGASRAKASGSNRYLILRKTGGRSFNGDQNLCWTSRGGARVNFGALRPRPPASIYLNA